MSQLSEIITVDCPYRLAREYLARALHEPQGEARVMTLRLPLASFDIAKDVVVAVEAGSDPMHFDQPWKLRWSPLGGGPFPDFEGEITVRAGEDYQPSRLEVRGTYRPPGGALGDIFDTALGRRIAMTTARALLLKIAHAMEASYRELEAARQA